MTSPHRHRSFGALVLLVSVSFATTTTIADAQSAAAPPVASAAARPQATLQGLAVLGTGRPEAPGFARDDAFTLARAVYGSGLRPRALDELRARILAGDPPPPSATRELRDLAELRGAVIGEDAASRHLLTSIAQQLGVEGVLVVSRGARSRTEEAPAAVAAAEADAGPREAAAPSEEAGVVVRLFLARTGDFDAARYEPDRSDATAPWRGTVRSLSDRFPPPPAPAPAPAMVQLQVPPPSKLPSEGKDSKPFYASPWLWGGIGAALLLGGFFYFASQDTQDDPIHLQMRVPR